MLIHFYFVHFFCQSTKSNLQKRPSRHSCGDGFRIQSSHTSSSHGCRSKRFQNTDQITQDHIATKRRKTCNKLYNNQCGHRAIEDQKLLSNQWPMSRSELLKATDLKILVPQNSRQAARYHHHLISFPPFQMTQKALLWQFLVWLQSPIRERQ